MFTALILMCSMETMKTPATCTVLTSTYFFETMEECQYDVMRTVAIGDIEKQNPGLHPVDYMCVNWLALKA